MGVVRRGQPGPDIQELPDTRLCDQEVHRPGQERPLRPDREHHIRVRGGDLLGDRPVSREVVLAAQPEVVNPRHMSPACVERDIPARRLLAARHLTPFAPDSRRGQCFPAPCARATRRSRSGPVPADQ